MKKITVIIIEILEEVKNDIKRLPTKQSLFSSFEKVLNKKLNTQALRQEIINIMLSLEIFRENEQEKISFEYIEEVLQKFETEKREYTNTINNSIVAYSMSQLPEYKEVNRRFEVDLQHKYIDILKEEIDDLISKFNKGKYNKGIKRYTQKSNGNNNMLWKQIIIGVVTGVIVLIIGNLIS